jgi:hypothetical protein
MIYCIYIYCELSDVMIITSSVLSDKITIIHSAGSAMKPVISFRCLVIVSAREEAAGGEVWLAEYQHCKHVDDSPSQSETRHAYSLIVDTNIRYHDLDTTTTPSSCLCPPRHATQRH